jgi:hypothetical protein
MSYEEKRRRSGKKGSKSMNVEMTYVKISTKKFATDLVATLKLGRFVCD